MNLNPQQFSTLYGTNTPAQNRAVADAAGIMESESYSDVEYETDKWEHMEPNVTVSEQEDEEQGEWVGKLETRNEAFARDFNRADEIDTLHRQFHGTSGFGPDSYRGKQMSLPGI